MLCRLMFMLIAACALLSACGPEAERTRGGGPGADIGNRGAVVDLHGGTTYRYPPLSTAKGVDASQAAQK
jgi:hypothetical protein